MEFEDWSLTSDWSLFGGQIELLESQNVGSLEITDELGLLLDSSKAAYYSLDNDIVSSSDPDYRSPADVFGHSENLDREQNLTCIEDQIVDDIMGVLSDNYIEVRSDLLDMFDEDVCQEVETIGNESTVTLPPFLFDNESDALIDPDVDCFEKVNSLRVETDSGFVFDSGEHCSSCVVVSSINNLPSLRTRSIKAESRMGIDPDSSHDSSDLDTLPGLHCTECYEVENDTDATHSNVSENSWTSFHKNDFLIIKEEMCDEVTYEECVDITDCDSAFSSDDRDSVLSSSPTFSCSSVKVNSHLQFRQETANTGQDRKLRKKEQNKTAALRYRQKKRSEQGLVLTEYALLERRNVELKTRVDQMTQEISYLRKLINELCP